MSFGIRNGIKRLLRIDARTRSAIDREMDEELRFYLDARVEHLVARGVPRREARAEARRRMGDTDTRERLHHSAETRERRMRMHERIDDILQDVRYAARGLLNRRGFTFVAIATLAIGIGANTAIFGAINALLLRPLPFREPDRLMEVNLAGPRGESGPGMDAAPWSFAKFVVFRDAQRSFQDVALWSDDQFNLTNGNAERVDGENVSARYLATLGITPALGRDIPAEEDAQQNAPRDILISDALWSRRFNADNAAIGKTVDIDGEPFQVIGVVPRTFRGLSGRADVFVPITTRTENQLTKDWAWSLEFNQIGRLRPGVTLEQAAAEAKLLGKRVYEAWPMGNNTVGTGARAEWGAFARPLGDTRVAPAIRRSLLILFGAVGFVLLIACVNLANLLLGRAATRRREIAVRLAIGARRGRIVRLLLTESVLLALLGGVASVLVAWLGTRALSAVNPQSALQAQGLAGLGIVSFSTINLDYTALAFTLGVAMLVGVLFGLLPALSATRVSLQENLKDGDATMDHMGRVRRITGRRALVVAEMALAIVLLVGAGLMTRSLSNRLRVNPGFNATNLLTLRLTMSPTQVSRDSLPGFYDQLVGGIAALPGVEQAALADCPPLNGGCNGTVLTFPDRPKSNRGTEPSIGVHVVTPGWFKALQVPLRRGRLFTDADRVGTDKVLIISESAAKKYWPNADPLGTRAAVWQGGFHTGATVIGIVGDVRYGTIDSLPLPDSYMSYNQSPRSRMMIFVRTKEDPLTLAGPARRIVHNLSPNYPAYDIRTMSSRIAAATTQARLSAMLLALFAGVALVLAGIGIYGVLSFAVSQRTREIGIRMALGANAPGVLRLVIGEGAVLAALGAIIGTAAALGLTRVLRSLLYDVAPTDPVTYVTIVALVAAAAFVASWFPARRAARVDPNIALRAE